MPKNKLKAIAYHTGFSTNYGALIIIYDIENGIDDFVIWGHENANRYHKSKIYYNSKGGYFIAHNTRILLNECVKVKGEK